MTQPSGPAARPIPHIAPVPVRCVVSAAARDTEYLRAGWGLPPVVLLAADGDAPALVAPLARHFRVVAPGAAAARAAGGREEFVAWLRDFIDGVGLPPVALVAEPALADAGAGFAAAEPARVACLVLLGGEPPLRPECPLLLHPAAPGASADDVAAAIAPFIAQHR